MLTKNEKRMLGLIWTSNHMELATQIALHLLIDVALDYANKKGGTGR